MDELQLEVLRRLQSRNYVDGSHNMANATNQSQHRQMDNLLLEAHRSGQDVGGFYCNRGGNQVYVSRQDMVDRVSHKIDAAKASGAIHTSRYRNFLQKSAERLNMDKRVFNRYN
jgi:hypothetical protein